MTEKEKLLKEFEAAINAILGDDADKDSEEVALREGDIDAIARKVKFYLFG